MLSRWIAPFLLVIALPSCSSAPPPAPRPVATPVEEDTWQEGPSKLPEEAPRSGGSPENGWLVGGRPWKDSPVARRPASRGSAAYGVPELIDVVQRAAGKVAKDFPRSVLIVGDLSGREGGPIHGHNSHQNGRDIDLGFYILDEEQRFTTSEVFVHFDSRGKHFGDRTLQFDDLRNWALVQALLTDEQVEVRTIFIAAWLRDRLLRTAMEFGASKELLNRASGLLIQPPNSPPHDDHFHVRISCPAAHKPSCVDHSFGIPKGLVSSGLAPAILRPGPPDGAFAWAPPGALNPLR
ncbi:MAG: penicillin-insensitive murein endopeptidase [Polyangiaceae bacterium]|nr:penicillin-insensitive murein endopeptidase [Polyangiaceae bacterium]